MRQKLLLLTFLIAASSITVHGKAWRHLTEQLAKQGFSGALKGKVHISRLGTLQCNSTKLSVYYYEWEESHPPGKAIHASHRLIFMDPRSKYLGHYLISDPPFKTGQSAIYFDYSKEEGNLIQCGFSGLPAEVVLSGEQRILEK